VQSHSAWAAQLTGDTGRQQDAEGLFGASSATRKKGTFTFRL
jgi:hypothetical protein